MRCYFIIDRESHDSPVRVDTRLDFNSGDTPSEHAFGTAFNDWLLMLIARTMDGEDDQEDITHGRKDTAKRFKFTWRRVKVTAKPSTDSNDNPSSPMVAETGFWDMEVPDEIALGTAGDEWSGMFISLTRMFLTNPYVRPGRMTMKFLKSKGFDTVEEAVKGLLPGDLAPEAPREGDPEADYTSQTPPQTTSETPDESPPEHQS